MDRIFWEDIIYDLILNTKDIQGILKTIDEKERIRKIEIITQEIRNYKDYDFLKINKMFSKNEIGYTTPKLRAKNIIISNNKILLIKKELNNWILPVNWVEYKLSAKESIVEYFKLKLKLDILPKEIIAVNKIVNNEEGVIELLVSGTIKNSNSIDGEKRGFYLFDLNIIYENQEKIEDYQEIVSFIRTEKGNNEVEF